MTLISLIFTDLFNLSKNMAILSKKIAVFLLCSSLFLVACNSKTTEQTNKTKNMDYKTAQIVTDKHSFARPNEAVMKHLNLELEVDFEQKILKGKATCVIKNVGKSKKLYLDTKGLAITKVELGQQAATFRLGEEKAFMGQALEIDIFGSTDSVTIFYSTSPNAEALQWLASTQTAGKKNPFLFTQSQAILARSWVPCQDSPGIRFTYNAKIKVPANLMAVMSANNPTEKNTQGIYQFSMEKPIPAYLLALAVGDFSFKPIGMRTGVYAETATIEKAVAEFSDMENMLAAAEKLYGAYDWGRYDVIVMPPSFPFGGMENPKLTFVTPTIITGDKSLVSLVAHELAHSWSGNLVTNATWEDFWLNEGFTVYFELRIMEALYGKNYAAMLELIGLQDLKEEVAAMNNGEETKLKLDLTNKNPDDGVTHIAYEKGFFFLRTIEEAVGREKFDVFVKHYFKTFAYQTIETGQFIDFLNKNLLDALPAAKQKINVEKWVYETGLPTNYPEISSERFEYVDKCIAAWLNGSSPTLFKTSNWSSHEWIRFLRSLPENTSTEQLTEIDKIFKLSATTNAEIAAVWFTLAAKKNYTVAYLPMEKFLVQVGRRKFIVPIYQALYKNGDQQSKNWAEQTYKKSRQNYHFVATMTLDKLFGMN